MIPQGKQVATAAEGGNRLQYHDMQKCYSMKCKTITTEGEICARFKRTAHVRRSDGTRAAVGRHACGGRTARVWRSDGTRAKERTARVRIARAVRMCE